MIECEFDGDVQTLGSMLKCAANLNQFDFVERVWKWSQPIRESTDLMEVVELIVMLLYNTHSL